VALTLLLHICYSSLPSPQSHLLPFADKVSTSNAVTAICNHAKRLPFPGTRPAVLPAGLPTAMLDMCAAMLSRPPAAVLSVPAAAC
jgi:hypothetical protein